MGGFSAQGTEVEPHAKKDCTIVLDKKAGSQVCFRAQCFRMYSSIFELEDYEGESGKAFQGIVT